MKALSNLPYLYTEYLAAAQKHLETSKVLIEFLETASDFPEHKKTFLLLKIYYLTGYVFECSIKYGIFKVNNFSKIADVEEFKTDDLEFKNLKVHKFINYADYLNREYSNIPLVDDKECATRPVQKLYNNWDPAIRYRVNEISEKELKRITSLKNLKTFHDLACEALCMIRDM